MVFPDLLGGVVGAIPLDPPWDHAVVLAGSFVLLVGGAELFTTGVEWTGHHLEISDSATGSVFAALATTLPETLIPVVAILSGSGATVGVGSIVGGPLFLTTVAPLVLGVGLLVNARRGGRPPALRIDATGTVRDLRVFLVGFAFVLVTIFVVQRSFELVGSALAVGVYGWYLRRTLRAGREQGTDTDATEALEFGKVLDRLGRSDDRADDPGVGLVAVQTLVAVALLTAGSDVFVAEIEWASTHVLSTPPLVVALLAAPLASNVPEGVDGLVWIARGHDTLAVDQLTGALAFQGTVLAALAIALTPWTVSPRWATTGFLTTTAVAGALAAGGGLYLLVLHADGDGIEARALAALGLVYLAFLGLVGYYVLAGYVG